MKDIICGLIRLQDLDNRIRKIDAKKKEGPLKIQRLENELMAGEMVFKEDSDRLELLKKDRHRLEKSIQDLESKMEKSQIKLSGIKSNKEYTAMLKEIDGLEREKSLTEDSVLQGMEEIDGLERKCLENRNALNDLKKRFEEDKKEVEAELEELNKNSALIEKQRVECCETIDQELLRKYLFLKDRKGGVAIGSVVEGICRSCNLKIPPQQFNELIKCKSLMSCPSCNRIIYWGEDEVFMNAITNDNQIQKG